MARAVRAAGALERRAGLDLATLEAGRHHSAVFGNAHDALLDSGGGEVGGGGGVDDRNDDAPASSCDDNILKLIGADDAMAAGLLLAEITLGCPVLSPAAVYREAALLQLKKNQDGGGRDEDEEEEEDDDDDNGNDEGEEGCDDNTHALAASSSSASAKPRGAARVDVRRLLPPALPAKLPAMRRTVLGLLHPNQTKRLSIDDALAGRATTCEGREGEDAPLDRR